MLWVNERPPLRLAVSVTSPAGITTRWGPDDPNPANVPSSMTLSSAMPGGFDQFSCTLERDPRRSYPDLEPFSTVTVTDPSGQQVAWQGRLDALPDTSGDEKQVQPQATGFQAHLQDNNGAAMIYVDQDLSNWSDPPLARQIALVNANEQQGSYSPGFDPANDQPSLIQEIDDSWSAPWKPVVESWYDAQAAGPIASIWYSLTGPDNGAGTVDANWSEMLALAADPGGSTIEWSSNLESTSTVTGTFTPASPYRFGVVRHCYTATPAGQQGKKYLAYWQLAVLGNHGLTTYGQPPCVLASDVIAHAVSTWAPLISFTTGANGTIQPSSFYIPQLAFTTPTTAAQIVQQAASFELLDWAVWEGPTMWVAQRAQPGSPNPPNRLWQARSGPAQLQNAGTEASRIYNGVIVQFSDISGQTLTVGPPGSNANVTDPSLVDSDPTNPANQAGINRWALVQLGTSTTQAAITVGGIFLVTQRTIDTSGQAMLTGHVQDSVGVWWPAWMVRAGDQISFVDAADTSPRRIVSASYDDSSKQCTIQLDQPPDSMTALLARLAVVLAASGLS